MSLHLKAGLGFGGKSGGGGAAAYTANAIRFSDTDNDRLSRSSALVGVVDGKVGLFSCWINWYGSDGAAKRILRLLAGGVEFAVQRAAAGAYRIDGRNEANSTILRIDSADNDYGTTTGWHHLLIAWDLANGVGQLYIDDVDTRAGTPTLTDDTIDYTLSSVDVSGIAFSESDVDLADFYFNPAETLDISVEANRRKFIDASGKPVDLGSDGSTPTGNSPAIFVNGNAATVNAGTGNNSGTGGDFTVSGTIADAPSSPSD